MLPNSSLLKQFHRSLCMQNFLMKMFDTNLCRIDCTVQYVAITVSLNVNWLSNGSVLFCALRTLYGDQWPHQPVASQLTLATRHEITCSTCLHHWLRKCQLCICSHMTFEVWNNIKVVILWYQQAISISDFAPNVVCEMSQTILSVHLKKTNVY